MKSIEEYTDYLFNCSFSDDSFDPEDHEDHLKASWELFENYTWEDIYPIWMKHLHENCSTPEEIINFVNLYIYYEADNLPIDDPIGFISYLYYKVDMNKYWDEAGELFEGFAINILSKHGLVNMMNDPYYTPLKDERITNAIACMERGKQRNKNEVCER